jgi:hypothetical protein
VCFVFFISKAPFDRNFPNYDWLSFSGAGQLLQKQAQQVKNAELARTATTVIQYEEYREGEVKRFFREIMPTDEYKQLFDRQRRLNRPCSN